MERKKYPEVLARAKKKYDAKNRVPISIMLNRKYDAEIIEKLEAQENRQAYIKELIKADIEKSK